jgi:predicted RNA-binding Zn-ribbon protein involved in translation (DUF1610 family)
MQLGAAEGAVPLADHRFPCPSCGSDLRYAPGTGRLKCPHCGNEEPIPESRGAVRELDLRAVTERSLPDAEMEETRVAQCASCGAQIEFDAELHARECPFCASPMVTDTGLHRHIKPQAQLPFLLTEAEARAAMNKWLGRLWFAPSDLVQYARAGRAMQGVYVPYWTYDAETRSEYAGQRGTVYYETQLVPAMVNGRRQMVQQQVARVRWQGVRGRVARDFDDVLVVASKSMPKPFAEELAPWDLSVLSAYDPRFLAGFRAEGYTVPVEEGYGEARRIMNAEIEREVRRDIGGDQQRITQVETEVGRLTFKHVLLPVWLAAYRYRGKAFRFVVNGRTGEVEGERPYSAVKIAFAIALALMVAALLAWFQIGQQGY